MKQIKLDIDKTKKYVVACSFGPDSMALLNAAISEGIDVAVAHVNYRKREAAQFEQDSLFNFCKNRNISFYLLDLKDKKHTGNFQDWAREQRYLFFKEVAKKEGADAVLVAHQEDDLIETYLMQKKRGNFAKKYGISCQNSIFGVKILRPLLGYSKQDLLDYDIKNSVPFSIDESNLSDQYTRNQIRHHIVEKLDIAERNKILREIANKEKKEPRDQTRFTIEEFLSLSYEEIVLLIDTIMQKAREHRNLSHKFINEIKKAFQEGGNHQFDITGSIRLELNYGVVELVNKKKLQKFEFALKNEFKNEFMDIDFTNGAEDRGISKIHNQFVVKNCKKNEKLTIKNYSSTIRRLFIDWKMPLYLREVWPGIYTVDGQLIYVPRYRKDFKDDHKSKFIINTDYFTKF